MGDRAGALVSITEAVALRRALASASPAAFTPDLVTSLNNLADRLADVGQADHVVTAIDEIIAGLGDGVRAELLVTRLHWRLRHGDLDGVAADLRLAARLADADAEDDPTWTGRARRAVRRNASEVPDVGDDLPAWVRAPLPDFILDILSPWARSQDWARREALLREAHVELTSDAGRAALDTAGVVFPESDGPGELSELVDHILTQGLEPVLAERRAFHAHLDQLYNWVNTKTWTDSHAYALRHSELLHDPRTATVLEIIAEDNATTRQHLAIVNLVTARHMPIDDVYDLVEDPAGAAATAMSLVDTGDTSTIALVLTATPDVMRQPFVAAYLTAVLTTLGAVERADDHPHAADLIRRAAEQANQTQRAAGAMRLRHLAAARPDLASALHELAQVLETYQDLDE